MREQLIRTVTRWLVIGLASGVVGSMLLGALVALLGPSGPLPRAIASGALVSLGFYLSSFFIWLPTSVALIAGSVAVSAWSPKLIEGKLSLAAALTVLALLVALILRFAIVPFSLPVFAFIWLTLVPPVLFLNLRGPDESDASVSGANDGGASNGEL